MTREAGEIRRILLEVTGDEEVLTLPASTPLLGAGLGLSSVAMARALVLIRERLGVDVAALDLNLDCLETIETLGRFVGEAGPRGVPAGRSGVPAGRSGVPAGRSGVWDDRPDADQLGEPDAPPPRRRDAMHPYVILDVFTATPLEGNQVAVYTDGGSVPPEAMQRAAREMSLSETVFVLPARDGADARIRIFTPAAELPFAGHPTLGSAFVVGARTGGDVVRLETAAGVVPVTLTREHGEIVFGEMEQPIPSPEPFELERELLAALRLKRSELPVAAYRNGPVNLYVALPDEAAVAALRPDLGALADLGVFGVSCFTAAGSECKTRMFAPALGVAEDPATGSAAGPLALHLARHGRIGFGQTIRIRQGEEIGRPSVLHARVVGDAERVERVLVGGAAVVVARGEYRLA